MRFGFLFINITTAVLHKQPINKLVTHEVKNYNYTNENLLAKRSNRQRPFL